MTEPSAAAPPVIEVDIQAALRRSWRLIALLAVVGAVVALVVTLLLPPIWEVHAALLLPDSQSSPSSAIAGVTASLGLETKAHPLDVLNGILNSHSARATIASKTGTTVRDLEKELGSSVDTTRNILTITMRNHSRQKALDTTALAIRVLDRLARDLNTTRAGRQAALLRSEVERYSSLLVAADRKLLEFQRHMKTAPPSLQDPSASNYFRQLRDLEYKLAQTDRELQVARASALSSARKAVELPTGLPVAVWRARILDLSYRLQVAQVSLGPREPSVVKLRAELDVARRQLRDEIANYIRSVNLGVDPSIASLAAARMLLSWQVDYTRAIANAAPDEAVELQRLLREQAVLDNVLSGIRADYAKAKIDADVDRVRFTILDQPYVLEDGPVNKRYVAFTAFGLLGGALLGAMIACLRSPAGRRAAD